MAVRRERVILELEDQFTGPIIRAAAATELLNKRLDSLSGEAVRSSKATRDIERDTDKLSSTTRRAGNDIDQYSGRLRILGQVAAALGPSVVPIAAVGIPAISGLTSALGFMVTGIGASAFAFKGLGDVIKAANKADLQPTKENLDALRVTMAGLSPETKAFVNEIRSFMPVLDDLQRTSAAGLFPGLAIGMQEAKKALPQVEAVISAITAKVGEIGADAGKSLGSGEWNDFLDFVGTEGPAALGKMASAAGNLAHGLAGLWMSTQPLNNDFLDWLIKATDTFDQWSNDLGQSEGFHEFVDYVHEIGPEVGDALGSVANAIIQVTEAAAPLGGPTLKIIESLANAIAAIADSPIGTPLLGLVSAMSALKLATRGFDVVQSKTFGSPAVARLRDTKNALLEVTTAQQRASMSSADLTAMETKRNATIREGIGGVAKTTAGLAGLAFASSGAADSLHVQNTASLALAGLYAGGPWGAAIGGAIGGVMDLTSWLGQSSEATDLQKQKWQDYIELVATRAGSDPKDQLSAIQGEIDKYQKLKDIGGAAGELADTLLAPLKMSEEQLKQNIRITDAMASSQGNAAKGMAEMSARARAQVTALNEARSASQSANQAFLTYGDTIGDTKKTIDQFIENFALKARALAEFGKNTQTAMDRGLNANVIEWLRSQGPEGALRLQQLAHGAQSDIVDMNKAWRQFAVAGRQNVAAGVAVQKQIERTKQAARDATAKRYMFQLDADTDPARAALRQLQSDIAGMHLTVKVTATTNATVAEAGGKANGGSIPKDGKPYGDRVLALLAPGEEVISNRYGQADQFRTDRASGRIPAYGDGGSIGDLLNSSSSSSSGSRPKSKSKAKGKKKNVLTQQEYRDALASLVDGLNSTLGLSPSGPAAEVRSAFAAFAKQIRDDGGRVGKNFHVLEERLVRSAVALKKEQDERQALLDQAQGIRDSVSSNYKSNPFSSSGSSVWMSAADRAKAGTGDVFSTLTGDISNANALNAAETKLKAKGLDGAAFADLVSNAPLDQVLAFANGSKADVQKYEDLYNRRAKAVATAGNTGATAAVGAALAANRAQTAALTKSIDRVEAQLGKVEKALHGVGPKRPRRGN